MFLDAVFYLADAVLDLLKWAVILAVLVQLLVSFSVLDTRNRVVWTIADFLFRVTEPLFRPVRNRLPRFGAFDVSPLVVLLLIGAAQLLLNATRNAMIRGEVYF